MFYKNKSSKEIIEQLKKENAQLKEENKQLFELYKGKTELQKIAENERALFKKLNAEAEARLEQIRKAQLEAEANAKLVREMKKRYEDAIDELTGTLNAWNAKKDLDRV